MPVPGLLPSVTAGIAVSNTTSIRGLMALLQQMDMQSMVLGRLLAEPPCWLHALDVA
jgi:hypothetical protein